MSCAHLVFGVLLGNPKKEDIENMWNLAGLDLKDFEQYVINYFKDIEEDNGVVEGSNQRLEELEDQLLFFEWFGEDYKAPEAFKWKVVNAQFHECKTVGIVLWEHRHDEREDGVTELVKMPTEEEKLEFTNWCREAFGDRYVPNFYTFHSY